MTGDLGVDIIGAMVTTANLDPNDPESILAHLREPLTAIHHSMDDGVSFADGTLDGQPWNPHVWATLVRYRALNLLHQVDKDGWGVSRALPNCGIAVTVGPLSGRLLKSQAGGPPSPGRNLARLRYWSQYHQLALNLDSPDASIDPVVGANLIIDWDVTDDREVILALSKPIGTWKYKGKPELEWRLPVMADGDELSFAGQDEDVDVEVRYDLRELDEGSGE